MKASGERLPPPAARVSGSPYHGAAHLRALMAALLSDAAISGNDVLESANPLTQRRLALSFDFRDPALAVLVDGRSGHTVQVSFGPVAAAPLTFSMDGETAHAFWMGELNVVAAMTTGRIRFQGALLQALSIAPMMPVLQRRYRALWQAQTPASGRSQTE